MRLPIDRGIAAAVLAPFFIALSIIITKLAGALAPPLVICAVGSLISVPLLLLMASFSRTSLDCKKLLGSLQAPFFKVVLTRAIIGQVLIISGFTLTTAVKSILLLRLEPLFVFVWSMLLQNEQPQARKLVLLLLLLLGTVLVVAPDKDLGGPNIGDALVVASLLFFSYSYMPTEEVVAQANPAGLNVLANLIAGIVITILALLFYKEQMFHLSLDALILIAAYSIVFFVFACTLYYYAFKTIKPWVIASFLSLEVVFGLILAVCLLQEKVSALQLIGAAIVLAATIAIGRLLHQRVGDQDQS